jgi:membrane-bound lytic murein transglycosylase
MFKKISSIFFSKNQEKVEEEPPETPEVVEEPVVEEKLPELPDVIEVPWKLAGRLKNMDNAMNKLHEDLKEFLYKNQITQKKTFSYLEQLEEAYDEVEEEIRKAYQIPDTEEYEFQLPEGTGRPGFLKRKKTNK